MAFQKPKYSKKRSVQKFNLKELLGRDPTDFEKRQFLAEALNFIKDRTEGGVDINGSQFRQYTKEYAEKKGVARSDVNLRLLGDMLSSMSMGTERKNMVKLEINEGTQALKSFNHNTGDTLPKRQFFGLNKKDAQEIADSIRPQTVADILDEIGGLQGELLDGEG